MDKQDLINDSLHIAWGAWIILLVLSFPVPILAPLAILPREIEQTWHALDDKSWEGFKKHADRRYWLRKGRDLGGFFLGGLLLWLLV